MRLPALPALLATAALAGCSLSPKYARPAPPVPASWPVGDAYLRQSEAALPSFTFEQVFQDPRLRQVIERALANNRDLRIAAANIVAARAQYRIQRAELFPEVDATGRYSYTGGGNGTRTTAGSSTGTGTTGNGTTGTGTTGTGNTGTGTTTGTGTGTGSTTTGTGSGGSTGSVVSTSGTGSAWAADLGVTAFEVDLFGRVRSLSQASLSRYFETEAAARSTRLTLVGDVATAWLTYAADKSLLKIDQDTATSAETTVRLTDARRRGGISPRTDVTQAQQVLAAARAGVADQTTLVAQDLNALNLLAGAEVDPSLLPQGIEQVAGSVEAVPAGLDSGILLRRPDVVQAEYELRATNAEIGAARAALFPRISLTGLVGYASDALRTLFTGGAFSYSVAPSISYPIFRAGAAKAGVRYSQAERDVALATYERAIQTAFRETADALARQGTIQEQLRANSLNVDAASDTLRLANASYLGGVTPFLNTLDAQRSLFTAQQTYIDTLLTAAANRVTLYRVLGGDSSLETTAKGPEPVTPDGRPR